MSREKGLSEVKDRLRHNRLLEGGLAERGNLSSTAQPQTSTSGGRIQLHFMQFYQLALTLPLSEVAFAQT